MPFVIPQLIKWTLFAVGSAAFAHLLARQARRVNEELDRMKGEPIDASAREGLPTLRRDPNSGDWRLN